VVASWRPGASCTFEYWWAGSGCGEAAGKLAASDGWPWPRWRGGAPLCLWLHRECGWRALANLARCPSGEPIPILMSRRKFRRRSTTLILRIG
jgi:hypothetical protein